MTISSETNRVQITSGTEITITNLEIQDEDHVLVTKTDSSGVETVLTKTTNYTVNSTFTTVTLLVALGASEKATATLNVPTTQGTEYKNSGPLNSQTVEDALDKLTLQTKQREEIEGRTVLQKISDTTTLGELPDLSSGTSKFLTRNSSNDGWSLVTIANTSAIDIPVTVANGGTGAITASAARTALGVAVGTDVQAYDADLTTVATEYTTATASTAASIGFKEDTDNGTNTCTLKGPTATADVTVTLPAATDTLVGKATTDTMTNKTLTSPVITTSPSATGSTWDDLGTVTTVDINGGSLDGATIGAASASTVKGSSLETEGHIVFPATQVASAGANHLDDYEEGSWTPVVTAGGNDATMSVQVGRYVKIGKQVTLTCSAFISGKGSMSGAVKISGIPFTAETVTNIAYAGCVGFWQGGNLGAANSPACFINSAGTTIDMWVHDATSGSTAIDTSEISTSFGIYITVTYNV